MGEKVKGIVLLIFLFIGLQSIGQISELSDAEDLKINEQREFETLAAFGQHYVQMLNEKDTLAILQLIASEKIIKKTIRSQDIEKHTKKILKSELKGDFNQRILAENLKLLSKLFGNLGNQRFEYVGCDLDLKTNKNDLQLGKADVTVSDGSNNYSIIVGRIIQTTKGWRVLQITDYFAEVKLIEPLVKE